MVFLCCVQILTEMKDHINFIRLQGFRLLLVAVIFCQFKVQLLVSQTACCKTLQRAGLNTLMGVGTVFVMLILLSLLISLFRFIPNPEAKKAAEAKAAKEAQAAVIAAAPVQAEENLADDGELVAVIAAAIAAAEGTTTDGFVVRSIRKVKRNRR